MDARFVGLLDGLSLLIPEGLEDGLRDTDGLSEGFAEGFIESVGFKLTDGEREGLEEGCFDGFLDGALVGTLESTSATNNSKEKAKRSAESAADIPRSCKSLSLPEISWSFLFTLLSFRCSTTISSRVFLVGIDFESTPFNICDAVFLPII